MRNIYLKGEKPEKLPSGRWEALKMTLETLGVISFIVIIETLVYHVEMME